MTNPPDWDERRASFGAQAAAYAHGRPRYPREALEWVLPANARRALDLGAGTGRLTEGLLDLGLEVVAVEPLPEMRAHVPTDATALEGTAEAIPLDNASVDCVVAGQAFHWFDVPRAMAEICRVLRPGGTVGLLWNMLDDADDWTARFAATIAAEEVASFLQPDATPPYSDVAGITDPSRRLFQHTQQYDARMLVSYVLSRSQTILMPEEQRDPLLAAVRELAPEPPATVVVPMVCEAWRGERV